MGTPTKTSTRTQPTPAPCSGSTRRSTPLRRGGPRGRRSEGNTQTGFLSSLRSHQRPELAIWTKEVPGSLRSHSWAVLLPHKEEDQPEAGGRSLFLRQQRHSPHLCHHGLVVSGAPRGGLLPVHCLL